ncbi:MAG: efflux RND transporter periplasmic adaptor subunit [Balneolales bacterium]
MNRFLNTVLLTIETPKSQSMQSPAPPWLFLFFTALMFVACSDSNSDETVDPDSIESEDIRPVVIFSETDGQPLNYYIDTQGRVEPHRELTLQTRTSGYIETHNLREGLHVETGGLILSLADDEWQLTLEEAISELAIAESGYLIEKNSRLRELQSDALSVNELKTLQNQFGYTQAQIRKRQAELNLSYARLTAPFPGSIHTKRNLSAGEYISAGTELGKLIDYSEVIVRFDMLESELTRVRPGMSVDLTTSFSESVTGSVETVSPVVDPESKTGQVIARFPNGNRLLRSGMTVDGRIRIQSVEGRTRAPRSAMLERDGRPLIFKLNGDTVEWVYVEPVAVTSQWIMLDEEEISPGDTLAVDQHFAISHLQKVQVRVR